MSAREAMRTLVTVGLTARISGDGVVVSQDPPAGTALDAGGVSRITLERSPARHLSSATQP
jgi:beta-lactam-binding protein with PASTA domain